ncbi:MAG TPA: hypothetical protein PLV45_15385, partial [bacterium]|nr:hypothetical protein [bacterium]
HYRLQLNAPLSKGGVAMCLHGDGGINNLYRRRPVTGALNPRLRSDIGRDRYEWRDTAYETDAD